MRDFGAVPQGEEEGRLLRSRGWWAAGAAIALGCTDMAPTEPAADLLAAKGGTPEAGAQTIVVMQQNLFVGFNIDALIAALAAGTPAEQAAALVTAYSDSMPADGLVTGKATLTGSALWTTTYS